MFTTLGSTLTLNPSLLPRARSIRAAPPTAYGAGHNCPAPSPSPHPRKDGASHTPTAPTPKARARKQASRGKRGRRGATTPHHPTKAPTPRKRKHPHEHEKAQPSHPRANTPTTSLSKVRPQANTSKRAHTNTCGHTKCERGNPRTLQRRPARNEAQTHDAGTQKQAHTKARKQPWFAPCAALRPQGEDSAREGRSQ